MQYVGKKFAERYLATYLKVIDEDERKIAEFLVCEYSKIAGAESMLDIGCGPGVQHVIPAIPYVRRIDMADFLPDNLAALRKWQARNPQSHNWQHFTKFILELEGHIVTPALIEEREEVLRQNLRFIKWANVLQKHPLGEPMQYPAVGFFYCAEAAARSKEQWITIMTNVTKMIEPGGHLFMASVRNTEYYSVDHSDGSTEQIPCASINEDDFATLLPQLHFDSKQTNIIIVPTSEMVGHGINEILLVSAQKKDAQDGSKMNMGIDLT